MSVIGPWYKVLVVCATLPTFPFCSHHNFWQSLTLSPFSSLLVPSYLLQGIPLTFLPLPSLLSLPSSNFVFPKFRLQKISVGSWQTLRLLQFSPLPVHPQLKTNILKFFPYLDSSVESFRIICQLTGSKAAMTMAQIQIHHVFFIRSYEARQTKAWKRIGPHF